MHTVSVGPIPRRVALLAINLLFLMLWGFASVSKLQSGRPSWFPDKFGPTFLATFPGLTATFWILTLCELLVFLLAIIALGRLEFLERRPATVLSWMLAGSLLVFVQLGLGQWLTKDFNAAAQLFNYFAGTLLALFFVLPPRAGSARVSDV
jgi:hypothetical protein